jgi:hypothetical protein
MSSYGEMSARVRPDLEIFSPPASSQPCAKTVLGSGSCAAISMAGHMTAWNQTISFPIMWTSAGQIRANRSSSDA